MGNSLIVQQLGLDAFTDRAQVQSLVRELRSYKLLSAARKKKKKVSLVFQQGTLAWKQ